MPDTRTTEPRQAHTGPAPNTAPPADASRVIVVDPDGGVRRVIALVLDELDCTTVGVPDAETALELLEGDDPALIVSEVRLPGMTGPALAETLRERDGSHPCFVLMSAYPRPPRGAEDYFLQKPLRFDRLLDITRSAMAERQYA